MDLNELRAKPHISSSAISDYQDCSLKYKFGRIDKIPREYVADALEFGTVIHKVLAEFYKSKMTGDRMLLRDIHDRFKQLWHEAANGRDDIKYAEGKNFSSYLTLGVDCLNTWYTKLSDDKFTIIAVEEAFEFTVPDLPIPIIGQVDLLQTDESGVLVITDWKTSGRAYSIDEVDNNQQLTIYQMAMKKNGFVESEILLKFGCLIKTQKPKFEQYYTTRSEIDEERLIKKIRQVWDGISKGVFIPNDTSWKHKNCPYRKACDEWFLDGGDR
jgi:putative RecB family exonuclease